MDWLENGGSVTPMAKRLLDTADLGRFTPIKVSPEDLYDDNGHLVRPDGDRDWSRLVERAQALPCAENTRRSYLAYWSAAYVIASDRDLRLEDPRLATGIIAAIIERRRQEGKKSSVATLRVVASAMSKLALVLKRPDPFAVPEAKEWLRLREDQQGRRDPDRRDPVLTNDIKAALSALEIPALAGAGRLRILRDRALLLLGWTCALRRSELVSVEVEHLVTIGDAKALRIPTSKTSRGRRTTIPIPSGTGVLDVHEAIKRWCSEAGITAGPLFRAITRGGRIQPSALSPESVRDILRRAGLGEDFSPHSLRRGFVTQQHLNGTSHDDIRIVTRHRTNAMVDVYTQEEAQIRKGIRPMS